MGSDISRPEHPNAGGFMKRRGSSKKQMPRRLSMGPPVGLSSGGMDHLLQDPPSIRVGSSGSTGVLNDVADENDESDEVQYQRGTQSSRHSLSTDQLNTPRSRSGSSGGDQSPTKPGGAAVTTPTAPKHRCTLSHKNRQLIQVAFNNPHENIGVRILKRAAERRKDFGRFYIAVSGEQRDQIGDTIKVLLKRAVASIHNVDEELQQMAMEIGQRFVEYRANGFKVDYFAVLADSTITECVLLDAAVHPAATTFSAFSQFITMLFSSVRDGFYQEMRRMRRISNSFSIHSNDSSRKKLSVEDALKAAEKLHQNAAVEAAANAGGGGGNLSANASPRSLSPAADEQPPTMMMAANNSPLGGGKRNSMEMARKSPSSFGGGNSSQEIEEEEEEQPQQHQQLNGCAVDNTADDGADQQLLIERNNNNSIAKQCSKTIKTVPPVRTRPPSLLQQNKLFGNRKGGGTTVTKGKSGNNNNSSKSPTARKFSPPSSNNNNNGSSSKDSGISSSSQTSEQQQPRQPRMAAAVAH